MKFKYAVASYETVDMELNECALKNSIRSFVVRSLSCVDAYFKFIS